MIGLPQGFEFQGVYCFASKDNPSKFYYLPGAPAPETDPAGRPTLSLFTAGQSAILQLGVRWEARSEVLESLRKEISSRFPGLAPGSIQLAPVPASVESVVLAIGDGTGKFENVDKRRSSGYPPYAAIFNVKLDADKQPHVMAALNGRRGFLVLQYHITLSVEVSARTSVTGDVREDLAVLGKTASLADCRARVERAISENRLKIERARDEGASDLLQHSADEHARQKAAAALLEMSRQTGLPSQRATLSAAASLTEIASIPLFRETDVASWFASGGGLDHLQVIPSTSANDHTAAALAATRAVVVRLGFDAKEAPLAFVEVRNPKERGTMRPPDFRPVRVDMSETPMPLTITTNYTDGGPPFESTLDAGDAGELVLAAGNVGLALVTADGSSRRQAGARRVRVRVRYRPSGAGTEDMWTDYLEHDKWVATHYLVTRSAGLAGFLEIECTETTADGSAVRLSPQRTENSVFNL